MIRLATQTKLLIEESIKKDQGTAFRKALKDLLPKMEDAYRASSDGYRSHLGASMIGRDCAFELWLGYRWAEQSEFDERIIRLFNRGHLEEARFLAMLISAGIEVWYETEDGGQFKFSDIDGHFGSALDGIVIIPELQEAAYAEFKTHNDKSFKKLEKEGVQNCKYEHYVQMQICMNAYDLKYGVYFAVNKNDDCVHIEIIKLDKSVVKAYLTRAKGLIYAQEAPPRISNKSSWFQCKFCSKVAICHYKAKPDINCRTCALAHPTKKGWTCSQNRPELQDCPERGCSDHIYHPSLMQSVQLREISSEGYLELQMEDGRIVKHGKGHVSSKDLEL